MKHAMTRRLGLALVIAMLGIGLAACEDDPGPAEQAGENIDESMEEMGEDMEEMGDDIEPAADDADS